MKKALLIAMSLCLLLSVPAQGASAAFSVGPSAQTVLVDGKEMEFDAYLIDGSNYFKLRDIAFVLSGSPAQFSVDYDAQKHQMLVEKGKAYSAVGGELALGTDKSSSCTPSEWKLTVDGIDAEATAYTLGGNNYFKLRDLGRIFNFGVVWNGAIGTVEISPEMSYAAESVSPFVAFVSSKNKTVEYLKARLISGCPIVSYETEQQELESAAFSYDNALAALAFISNGNKTEAKKILDAFLTGIEDDRYMSDRVRNAYRAGYPSYLPGWWSGRWYEDAYQVGTNPGNSAFVALALLQYDRRWGESDYVETACTVMDWVIYNCSDTSAGFTAGYDGWPENGSVTVYTTKSTEHNIDAYAAFTRLYELTGKDKYKSAAASAKEFVMSMYSEAEGRFYLGTKTDGKTPVTDTTVLDAQSWAALSLGDSRALSCALSMKTGEGGYPFRKSSADNGFWPEGTAFTALALRINASDSEAITALSAMEGVQLASGGFNSSTVPVLDTGLGWSYFDVPHIAPAAWYILAINCFNPYEF